MENVIIMNDNKNYSESMIDAAIDYSFESVTIPREEVGAEVYQNLIKDKIKESLYLQYEELINL